MRSRILATLLVCVLLATVLPVSANAQSSTSATKVGQLLQGSGYNFKKKSDTVWTIAFTGKSLKTFDIILATQDDLLVSFVIVAKKAQLQVTPEFMRALLKFNHDLDRVKVGLDGDGDLFVRCDTTVRVMDAQEFKVEIDQVAAAANEVYADIAAYLSSGKG